MQRHKEEMSLYHTVVLEIGYLFPDGYPVVQSLLLPSAYGH